MLLGPPCACDAEGVLSKPFVPKLSVGLPLLTSLSWLLHGVSASSRTITLLSAIRLAGTCRLRGVPP